MLAVREAYRLWADGYEAETALSALEDRQVSALTPPLVGQSLLDAGCGTGRRLSGAARQARRVAGVDLVPEMLRAARRLRARPLPLAIGDVRALPFPGASFDVVWCRLVLGHLPVLDGAYRELARVSRPGAHLIVSDFHPRAVAAGHTRTFRDAAGRLHAVEHHAHAVTDHRRAARDAGWTVERIVDAAAGPEERPFYEQARREEQFERERELPLVLVLCCRR